MSNKLPAAACVLVVGLGLLAAAGARPRAPDAPADALHKRVQGLEQSLQFAEESLGRKLRALELYHDAVATQPDNPETYVQLGAFELRTMGDPCSAYADLNHAYTLDRFNPVIAKKGGPLDVARAKVNAGACGMS